MKRNNSRINEIESNPTENIAVIRRDAQSFTTIFCLDLVDSKRQRNDDDEEEAAAAADCHSRLNLRREELDGGSREERKATSFLKTINVPVAILSDSNNQNDDSDHSSSSESGDDDGDDVI